MLSIVFLVIIGLIAGLVFLQVSPQFGARPNAFDEGRFIRLGNYKEGKFNNQEPTSLNSDLGNVYKMAKEYISAPDDIRPQYPIPVTHPPRELFMDATPEMTRVTWFGHSTIMLEIAGKKILIDPMLGKSASPISWLGPQRYSDALPIEIEALPKIDAVLISHDHYDHLDYGSILELKDKVDKFYVPLGVGAHLLDWGVQIQKIEELNWWESAELGNLTFHATPARHFSGRGLTDQFKTFWNSWVILSPNSKIFFSGDTGYGSHFKEIGIRFGDFDFVMLDSGQYNERWPQVHMFPEEAVQASIDLGSEVIMPIHWGAFTMAMHPWTEPAERVVAEANRRGLFVAAPMIGQPLNLGTWNQYENAQWW